MRVSLPPGKCWLSFNKRPDEGARYGLRNPAYHFVQDIFVVSYGVGLDTQSRLPVCSCSGVPGRSCPHIYYLAVVFGKLLCPHCFATPL